MNRIETARIIQFVGGPSDGLVVRDPQLKTHDMLRLPPVAVSDKQRDGTPVGQWSTTYVLVRQQCRMEGGEMMNCLRYEFLGYERFESPANRDVAQPTTARARNRLRRWSSEFSRKFTSWMLEPINYPLKMRGEAFDRVARG